MAKNPNGAGTVYKEKGRGWASESWVDLPDGRRKRVRGRGATPALARMDRVLKEERLVKEHPAANDMTVAVLARQWLTGATSSGWSAETRRSYRTVLKLHVLPRLGGVKVQRVTALEVQRVLDAILEASGGEHVSVANRARRVMHTLFQHAVAWGVTPHNPVASVKPVKRPVREQAFWTREEAQAFLAAADGSPYRLLFETLLVTGLRVGEAIALQWRDVQDGLVHVHRTYSQSATGRVQDHPKSRTSNRRVPLPPSLADRLEGRRGPPEGLVFASRTGRLLNPGNVHRALRNYARKAGVPVIRVHDLRRSYASFLAGDGYHPSVIQRLLGHASPDLALRVYTSVHEGVTDRAVVTLGGHDGGNATRQSQGEPSDVKAFGGHENPDGDEK